MLLLLRRLLLGERPVHLLELLLILTLRNPTARKLPTQLVPPIRLNIQRRTPAPAQRDRNHGRH